MSHGHQALYDDAVTPQAERKLRQLLADHPELEEFADEGKSFSAKFDIPWVAGRSRNGSRGYMSSDVRLMRDLKTPKGQTASVWIPPYVLRHEFFEFWLMTHLGMPYEEAHHIATAAEKMAIERAGYTWESYRAAMEPDIRRDEDISPKKVPPDLDLRPYEEGGAKSLLRKIHVAQESGKRNAAQLFGKGSDGKSSQSAAHYQDHPSGMKRCDRCSMFVPPRSCTSVSGRIKPFGYCQFFERKDDGSKDHHTEANGAKETQRSV